MCAITISFLTTYPRSIMKPSRTLINQIVKLLVRDHECLVNIQVSQLEGAGHGVFAGAEIKQGCILCLYPGVYTPPLPSFSSDEDVFLANIESPTGRKMEECAYILNLQPSGGFLDGEALVTGFNERMDTNPSACGHLVNHSSTHANVDILNFQWRLVLENLGAGKSRTTHFPLPNTMRLDGSPWYFDSQMNEVVRLNETHINLNSLSGAAFYATRNINPGDELLLNYRLQRPYPDWAKDWYS